jgi:hypothetical protein
MTDEHPRFTLDDLFLYLGNAVMCIPEQHQQTVFNDMAYKLIEWSDVPRSTLRKLLDKYGYEFEELCIHCNEDMSGWVQEDEDEPDPVCDQCKAEQAEEAEKKKKK